MLYITGVYLLLGPHKVPGPVEHLEFEPNRQNHDRDRKDSAIRHGSRESISTRELSQV